MKAGRAGRRRSNDDSLSSSPPSQTLINGFHVENPPHLLDQSNHTCQPEPHTTPEFNAEHADLPLEFDSPDTEEENGGDEKDGIFMSQAKAALVAGVKRRLKEWLRTESERDSNSNKKRLAPFQRLWSEEDEIRALEAVIEFMDRTKRRGWEDLLLAKDGDGVDLYQFLKDRLSLDLKRKQIREKTRRLRVKYERNVVREEAELAAISEHDRKVFELSVLIWGHNNQWGSDERSSAGFTERGTAKATGCTEKEKVTTSENRADAGKGAGATGVDSWPFMMSNLVKLFVGLDKNLIKKGYELLDVDKRAELNEKWRVMQLDEVCMRKSKLDLFREEAQLIVDALRSTR